ncbi:hypothetical protein A5800_002192 [Enterococcus sp. 5B7_DIV0075]|uniref:FtsX-like permease family protein n=1 Tax=Enterococcus sp. 5B7_DIV0075 TaxID=1987386 RepID=UPI000B62C4D8|nr:FtsX-like permease family protein [Enterococcus sp. 5B7_DIV0075]OTP24332.1 hypothetical protein A5800_002192 [Enterococcus sp. 5B7_DIV0075]
MKNLYIRSIFRDIRQSLGRFIAIILIIFMGVLLFVGIKSIGPNLEKTVQEFVTSHNVSDLQIQGTAGLTNEDLAIAEKVAGAKGELGYSFPYVEEQQDRNLQIYSYAKDKKQNKLTLLQGSYPKNNQQLLMDESLKEQYPLNSKITIKDNQLKDETFTVTGYVASPIYVDKKERGVTTVGDGMIDGYVYLPETAFASETYSILYLRFSDLKETDMMSDVYKKQMIDNEEKLQKLFDERKEPRKTELQDMANEEIVKGEQELQENQQKLSDGQNELNTAKEQLSSQQQQLEQQKAQLEILYGQTVADNQLASAQSQLEQAATTLAEKQDELTENQQKLTEAQAKIDESKKDVAAIKTPNYILTQRSSNPGFTEFTSLSDRIDAIGNVFPVFFFLIGILITFTTITRMVEEDRKEIGTLKALGYRNSEISQKYLLYALMTGTIGTVFGVIVGTKGLPPVVFTMLKKNYVFENYPTDFWPWPILVAILAALFATVAATIYILIKDLREKPMALLMPKAPKPGKRILLEYITPLWSRLSFNQKVTYRNLFRYKARAILTILGIAGCMGLMVAGFGLQDSIGGVVDVQFKQLNHFQGIITLEDEANVQKANKVLTADDKVKESMSVFADQVKFKKEGASDLSASLYAFKNTDRAKDYFTLKKANKKEAVKITDDGAVVTEGIAKAYDAKIGSNLTIQDNEGKKMKIKVSGIVENYLGNTIFMDQNYYQKVTDKDFTENTVLFKSHEMSSQEEEKLANQLQDTNQVTTTTFMSTQASKQAFASENLRPVVLIFIVLSGTLAFVVLFNLTNINVSERERELATIKVLGFFDGEVTVYIIRENVIFTLVGILLGCGVGKVLTWFIITMASADNMAFPLLIPGMGYFVSGALTVIFSAIVMFITHKKLKEIDMISALKSNE